MKIFFGIWVLIGHVMAIQSEDLYCYSHGSYPNGLKRCSDGGIKLRDGTRTFNQSSTVCSIGPSGTQCRDDAVKLDRATGALEIRSGYETGKRAMITVFQDGAIRYGNGVTRKPDGQVTLPHSGESKVCLYGTCNVICGSAIIRQVLPDGTLKTIYKMKGPQGNTIVLASIKLPDGRVIPDKNATGDEIEEFSKC